MKDRIFESTLTNVHKYFRVVSESIPSVQSLQQGQGRPEIRFPVLGSNRETSLISLMEKVCHEI